MTFATSSTSTRGNLGNIGNLGNLGNLGTMLDLSISATQTAKSGKTAPILHKGTQFIRQFDEVEAAFNASAFNEPEANRVNLCMRTTSSIEDWITEFEHWLLDYCTSNSMRIFGKELTRDGVAFMYTPLLKMSDKYPSTWKVKLNKTGRQACRCWDKNTRLKREQPDDWRDCRIIPRVWIKSLWIQSKSFGVIMELTDAVLSESGPKECPVIFESIEYIEGEGDGGNII